MPWTPPKPEQPKPAPQHFPGVEAGDSIYFHHPRRGPMSAKVLATGRHGCTAACPRGDFYKVHWEHVLGLKERMARRFEVEEHGEDGIIVRDQDGARRYVGIKDAGNGKPAPLAKAHVRGHMRTLPGGRIVVVNPYSDKRTKKDDGSGDLFAEPPKPEPKPEPPKPEPKPALPPDRDVATLKGVPQKEWCWSEFATMRTDPAEGFPAFVGIDWRNANDNSVKFLKHGLYFDELRKNIMRGHVPTARQVADITENGNTVENFIAPRSAEELPIQAILRRGEAILDRAFPAFRGELERAQKAYDDAWKSHREIFGRDVKEQTAVAENKQALLEAVDLVEKLAAEAGVEIDANAVRDAANEGSDIPRAKQRIDDALRPLCEQVPGAENQFVASDEPRAQLWKQRLLLGQLMDKKAEAIEASAARSREYDASLDGLNKARRTLAETKKRLGKQLMTRIARSMPIDRDQLEWEKKAYLDRVEIVETSAKFTAAAKNSALASLRDFVDLFGPCTLVERIGRDPRCDRAYHRPADGPLSHALNKKGDLNVGRHGGHKTKKEMDRMRGAIFHEAGHGIEVRREEVQEMTRKFLNYRCPDKTLRRLTDLDPSRNWDHDEVVREDGGVDPYVWKWYNPTYQRSSEIVSMATERFCDPETAIEFYLKDPEHFCFALACSPYLNPFDRMSAEETAERGILTDPNEEGRAWKAAHDKLPT